MKTKTLEETRAYHEKCNGNKPNAQLVKPNEKNADAKTAFAFLHNYTQTASASDVNDAVSLVYNDTFKSELRHGYKTKRAHNGYALNIGNKRICETLAKKNGSYSTAVNGEYFRRAKLDTVITDATAKANGGYYVIERVDKTAHTELLQLIRKAMIDNNVAIA